MKINNNLLNLQMILHSVLLTFIPSISDSAKQSFFDAAALLSGIPGVEKFELLKQVSPKNSFEYGISMEFANDTLYSGYNIHPQHQQFLQEYWKVYVQDFMEIDYTKL